MSGYYPDGCTQADHDRACGADKREECQTCDGIGTVTLEAGFETVDVECSDCNGTGSRQ